MKQRILKNASNQKPLGNQICIFATQLSRKRVTSTQDRNTVLQCTPHTAFTKFCCCEINRNGCFQHHSQDFSATVNMLMMLSKADLKLKSATRDEDDDTGDERAGSGEGRRSSSGGAGGKGRLRSRSRMLSSTPFGGTRGKRAKSKSNEGSKSGSRAAAAAAAAVTEGTSRGDGSDLLATHNVRNS